MAGKRPHPDQQLQKARRGSTSMKRFHHDSGEEDAWLVDGVYLTEDSLTMITQLFKLIDRNSDGKLDILDFTIDGTPATTQYRKWVELRQQFDLNGDGQITIDEFCKGFKKMVLALGCKITAANLKDISIHTCLRELELHINSQVQELCQQAFDWYRHSS